MTLAALLRRHPAPEAPPQRLPVGGDRHRDGCLLVARGAGIRKPQNRASPGDASLDRDRQRLAGVVDAAPADGDDDLSAGARVQVEVDVDRHRAPAAVAIAECRRLREAIGGRGVVADSQHGAVEPATSRALEVEHRRARRRRRPRRPRRRAAIDVAVVDEIASAPLSCASIVWSIGPVVHRRIMCAAATAVADAAVDGRVLPRFTQPSNANNEMTNASLKRERQFKGFQRIPKGWASTLAAEYAKKPRRATLPLPKREQGHIGRRVGPQRNIDHADSARHEQVHAGQVM